MIYASDIFCFPSITKNEAFGLALAEAMYYEKPAITFTIPGSGVNYVNLNDETGIEVDNRNVKKYAEAIEKLAEDKNLRKKYGEAGRMRVMNNFLSTQYSENIRNLVKEMITEYTLMIITKTPFRMSFFGGGTDMENYFRENGGAVLSTTFDKYCYVNVRHLPRFFDYSTELSYSKTERVADVENIQHPAIRNAMNLLDMHEIRLTYEADLPARSGLGTSSSFAVGMLNAFYALKGKYADKKKLADEAIYLERILCKEAGGWQDQIAASFGGFNRINFDADGYEVLPVIISPERKKQLNENLMMFFTGFTRFSSDVQKANNITASDKKAQLKEMYVLVDNAERVLTEKERSLHDFGYLLDHTWKLKRQTGSAISTNSIDALYQKGIKAGALGGKLLGAGGGGFLVFYVQPEKQEAVHWAMKDLMYIPFQFENGGTRIIHYTPETYEPRA